MRTLFLCMIALSIHGIIFTDEMTIASKVFGLCILIMTAIYLAAKTAFTNKNEDK